MPQAALVQQADRGNVGQRLPDAHVGGVKGARAAAEQVQRADHLIAQPHRQRLHGREPGLPGSGREPRPALRLGVQVRRRDRLAGPEAVQARTLVVLQLE